MLLELIRIKSWKAYLGVSLFGYVLSADSFDLRALIFFATMFCYLAFAFAINNCYDVDTDIFSARKNPVASGSVRRERALFISYIFAISGLFISSFLSLSSMMIYVFMLLLAYLYSAPPRLKGLPPVDMLSHGLFFGALIFLFGVSISAELQKVHIAIAFSVFLYSCLFELKNHIEDFEGDRSAGVKTSAVLLGDRRYGVFSMLSAAHLAFLMFILMPNALYPMCALLPAMPRDAAIKHFQAINAITASAYVVLLITQRLYSSTGFFIPALWPIGL